MLISTRRASQLGLVLLLFGAAGCATTREDAYPKVPDKIPFVPLARDVSIQASEGRYPGLYTTRSRARWGEIAAATVADEPALDAAPPVAGDSAVTGDPAGEPAVTVAPSVTAPRSRGLKITCYLESEFSDMSIAYDAVGLRGVDFYLDVPGGPKLPPSQKVLESELVETPVGALRRFGRTITLYFPESLFLVENPVANPAAPGVRLVLEGHGTTFYFEWQTTPDFLARTEPRADHKLREAAGQRYRATSSSARELLHTFD